MQLLSFSEEVLGDGAYHTGISAISTEFINSMNFFAYGTSGGTAENT